MADEKSEPGEKASAEEQANEHVKDYFLALAAKGKDVWNAWRCDPANNNVAVNFAGIDFSEAPRDQINFEGFDFGGHANFSGCKWRGVTSEEKRRRSAVVFTPGRAFFLGAAFGDHADFTSAVVGERASFNGATFGNRPTFSRATFSRSADFTGAKFGKWASFTGAAFGDQANFNRTHFKGQVYFAGMSTDEWASDIARTHGKDTETFTALKQRHEESWDRYRSGPGCFLSISFKKARIDGQAIFSGRSFESRGDFTAKQRADFTNARFCSPPR
jgi:hypothetical protein